MSLARRKRKLAAQGLSLQPYGQLRANVLERAVLLENVVDALISAYIADSEERRALLTTRLLVRISTSEKLPLLRFILERLALGEVDPKVVVSDLSALFELRNALAHSVADPQMPPNSEKFTLTVWRRPGPEPLDVYVEEIRNQLRTVASHQQHLNRALHETEVMERDR